MNELRSLFEYEQLLGLRFEVVWQGDLADCR